MASGSRGRVGLLLGGLAAGGVVAAHALAYLIAVPHPDIRAHLLEATGHGHKLVVAAALGVVVAGLVRMFLGRLGASVSLDGRRLFAHALPRLVVLQVVGFVALEASERCLVGAPVGGLFAEPAVVLGVVLQVVGAMVGSALLALLATTIEHLVGRWTSFHGRSAAPCLRPPRRLPVSIRRIAAGGVTPRGPPLRA